MRLLESVPPGIRPVLHACGAPTLTGDDLCAWSASAALAAWRAPFAGARVGVACRAPGAMALTLLALDGAAAAIVPLPAELSTADAVAAASRAGLGAVISDTAGPCASATPVFAPPAWDDAVGARAAGAVAGPDFDTEWVLPTSGTTRTPKLVAHALDTLTRSVKRDPHRGAALVWGLMYDLNRFAGLQVFFQALLGGSALVLPPAGAPLPAVLDAFARAGVNAISATPTLWRKVLMTPESVALALRRVTLGGEIADAPVLAALARRFPAARIAHIYASTEAGVGFAVGDGREGFPAEWLVSGVPGAELRVNADEVLEIRSGARGRRYLGESEPLAGEDGFVTTGDRVRISGDRVIFLGRDSGAINVGGNKVRPEAVEQVLLAHPAVAFAQVGAMRSGITGALVEARVVTASGVPASPALLAELRAWCAARLERHQCPAVIRFVEALSVGASGKLLRGVDPK